MKIIGFALAWTAAVLFTAAGEELGQPVSGAHSHNDYEHSRPLWDALAQGFCSIEADIYRVNGQLLVAHNLKDAKPERTLQSLYLEPLRALAQKNGGSIYPKGPPVTLLVDIKSEAEATYAALKPILQEFAPILTRFRKDGIETNAVTVILSGNRPRQALSDESNRLAAYDGRLSDLGKGLAVSFMPLVSDNFAEQFPSIKTGQLSAQDRLRFEKAIRAAHHEGRAIRFWATADDQKTWKFLRDAGVDLINTDDLQGLAGFLRAYER